MSRNNQGVSGVFLDAHGSIFLIFRNLDFLPGDDVSARQMTIQNAISLCWLTMLSCCVVHAIKTWCEALSSRSPGGARLPKCQCVTFPFDMPVFDNVFWDYHIVIWPPRSKCHLGKPKGCVRSPWILLVPSRSQNRL